MNKVEQVIQYFHGLNVPSESLILLAIGLGLAALLFAVLALRRLKLLGFDNYQRMRERVEQLALTANDLRSQLSTELQRSERERRALAARVEELEDALGGSREAVEGQALSKKKSLIEEAEAVAVIEQPQGRVLTGLQKTRSVFMSRLRQLFTEKGDNREALLQGLEELLILSDIGVGTTRFLLQRLRDRIQDAASVDQESLTSAMKEIVREILHHSEAAEIVPKKRDGTPLVVAVVGVNGVGKTTTIGKLAARFKEQGANVLIGACDTFRAAAVEQMSIWAERCGAEVVKGADNAKPTTVAFQTVARAKEAGVDIVLLDTAGRLHTRVNLMNELSSVLQIVGREIPGAPHETLLVIDASTGQNALQQAREFHARSPVSGLIVTKLDGTPKGGVVVGIRQELGIPVRYIGVGEGIDDLRPFSADEYVDALFTKENEQEEVVTSRGEFRRQRRQEAAQ